MSEITGSKIPLHKLFSNDFFFKVPEYQRPYSWEKEHCEQLFDDIYESNRDSEYFLGTIILQEIGDIGIGKKYDIIDGQQRITTLQILLACLRDKVDNENFKASLKNIIFQSDDPVSGIPERPRLEVKEKDFFRKYIQEIEGTKEIHRAKASNDQQQNIKDAITMFNNKISSLAQGAIENIVKHISQKCIVIFVATKEFDDAYKLFSIINDRGLQLRRIDILKAQNIDPSLIGDIDTRREYAKIWEDMEDELGADEFEKLFFILRTIEVKEKAKEDLLKEFEKNIFGKGKISKGQDFINYLKEYHKIYKDLILDSSAQVNDKDRIKFYNLLYIMRDYLKGNDWIAPLLRFYKKYGGENILPFLKKLEQKYSSSWLTGKTKDKRLIDMCSILKVMDNNTSTDSIINSPEMQFNWNEVESVLNDDDFYKKPYAKYILVKLEFLCSEHNTIRQYGATSIEHVLPQNPKADSEWNKLFSDELKLEWTHKISNLILLSKRKNSLSSNLDFQQKKDTYFNDHITDLPRSLQILNIKYWTPKILMDRQNSIISLIKNI